MYSSGKGVAKDQAEAARLFRLAADQGEAMAQLSLGEMYYTGAGVAKDEVEAARLFRLAADQGDAQAQDALSAMYSRDEIVRTPTPATISAPHTRMLKPTRLKRYSPRLRTMARKQARVCAGRGRAGRGAAG
jgi:TPR repeat protein